MPTPRFRTLRGEIDPADSENDNESVDSYFTSKNLHFSMDSMPTPRFRRESLYRQAEPKKAQPTWGELCPCPGSFVGQSAALGHHLLRAPDTTLVLTCKWTRRLIPMGYPLSLCVGPHKRECMQRLMIDLQKPNGTSNGTV